MINWKQIGLGDTATFYNGYAFKPSDWSTSGKEIIRIQNLTKGSATINYFQGEIAEKYKVRKGDILISWSGSLGVYEWSNEDSWLNQHLFKVVFDKEDIDKSFFTYLISNSLKKLETQVHGATMKHITKKKFDAFPVSLPPLDQQKKIAAILDAADAYRQKTKALITKYEELTQSLFLDMFGDPVRNPMGWDEDLLNNLCSKISVGFVGVCNPFYCVKEEGVPMLRTGNLGEGFLKLRKLKYVTNEFHAKQKKSQLSSGDILIARHGDNGKAVLYQGEYDEANCLNIIILRPSEKLTSFYVQFLLNNDSTRKKIAGRTGGATQKVVNTKEIQKLDIPVPPINLQNQFTGRVKAIEAQKSQAQASLVQAEDLFNSLLQRAFKGELAA